MEVEGTEQNIVLQPEGMIVGAVTSVNGQTGDVVLTTSDLENTSDYQTGADVQEAIAGKQDKLTAGNNIQISEQNVISATNTTYSAGNGINISGENAISVDTTVVATQQNLSDEVTNRENADIYLQGQIDAISASSDVVDIVGTYAELQAYDTQHLKDNDIIKVLQDETQGDATTYYRWSTSTQTFTLIGQEGPYYTKAGADAQFVPQTRTVNGKALSANITLNASDVSALSTSDVAQTTGSSTSMVMSQKATTDALGTKLNITDYVVDTQLADSDNPVQNRVLNGLLGNMPSDFFSGSATTTPTASTEVQFGNILNLDDVQLLGDTYQQTYSGKNLFNKNATPSGYGGSSTTITTLATGVKITLTGGTGYGLAGWIIGKLSDYVGKTVTLSANIASSGSQNPRMNIGICNDTFGGRTTKVSTTDSGVQSISWTVEDDPTSQYLQVSLYAASSAGVIGDYCEYSDLQLEIGSTATSYEPYTGGIPAPNPDYPQPIQVVTGEQTVTVTGKNLLDSLHGFADKYINDSGDESSGGGNNALFGYIAVKPNIAYTLSQKSDSLRLRNYGFAYYDANKTFLSRATYNLQTTQTITTPSNCSFIRIWVANSQTGVSQDIIEQSQLQFEQGSATYYEPYQGATYTVDLGATELCKIGNYQDYIYKSGDDWYVHKSIKKMIFDGSSDENWDVLTNTKLFRIRVTDLIGQDDTTVLGPILSNYYSPTAYTSLSGPSSTIDYGVAIRATSSSGVGIKNIDVADVAGFKTWLSNNNTIVYAPLATPTDTKITDATLISELEALLNASTYDGETDFVITATGTNLPAPLQLTVVNANAKGIIYKLRA